jgi:hypothetical protein
MFWMNAQPRVSPQRVLRIFEIPEEIGKVHDAGDVGFRKLNPP